MTEIDSKFNLCISIITVVLAPVAVVGNALVFTAILRNSSLRTPSYIFLAGLAFTDFGTGLFSQSLYVISAEIFSNVGKGFNMFDMNTWPRMYLALKAVGEGFGNYFGSLTMLIITVMSIERWLHMSRRSLVTVRRAYVAIAVLLLLPIPLAVCRAIYSSLNIAVNATSALLALFCLVITSIAYFKVFRIIRTHQQQIHSSELSQNAAQPAIQMAKYKKSVFTILYILAIFLICYLPITISLGVWAVFGYENEAVPLSISFVLVFLSSSLNPALYLWRMKDIRNEVAKLIRAIFCKHDEN